jgi:nucleoside-diphosphate-sugar epimerase
LLILPQITGITGYIGFKTLTTALHRGFSVRGVVRNERNISKLEKLSSLVAKSHEQGILEFAVVPDFLEPNAIQNVLHGITSIVHLASPLAADVRSFFPF